MNSSSNGLFEPLPDDIVLSIFKKVHDAKSLCLSMSVCKRFHSVAPLVDRISLSIPQKTESHHETDSIFKNLIIKFLMKHLHFISQMINFKSKNEEDNGSGLPPYHVPTEAILKSFEQLRALHLRLPCHIGNQVLGSKAAGDNNSSKTVLKWKAEFGRELRSFVMLGAKSWSWREKQLEQDDSSGGESPPGNESRAMGNDELKLRIVWTISCLVAASARHRLIQETVTQLKTIESVVVSDENDQGRLCMNKEQIEEMKELKGKKVDSVSELMSGLSALRMNMWYSEKLELPESNKVMEGATLVVMSPAGGGRAEKGASGDADLVSGAFDENGEGKVLGEVVRRLMAAKKCYTLQMNAF